jgi:hypothetical protein
MVVTHPQIYQNQFNLTPYTSAGQNGMVPASANNYIQQQPLPRLIQSDTDGTRGILSRNTRQDFVKELPSASLAIKSEPRWNGPGNSPSANTEVVSTTSLVNTSNEVNFGTEVDILMKAIQAKSENTIPQTTSFVNQSRPVVSVSRTPPYV